MKYVFRTNEGVGCKVCGREKRRTAWWTDDIKGAFEEQGKTREKMLLRTVPREVKLRWERK